MLISVVIPAYNRAKYIERTLRSIKDQTYRPLELIIVDNNSTDATECVCKEFMRREEDANFKIKFFEETHPGASAARNTGLKEATGEWVSFFDSDDVMSPFFLEDAANKIKNNPKTELVACATCVVRKKSNSSGYMRRNRVFLYTADVGAHILMGELSTQSFIAKTEFIRRIGGWNEKLMRWNDWELGVRILLAKPGMVWLKERRYHCILEHKDSITGESFSSSVPHLVKAMETVKRDFSGKSHINQSALFAFCFRANILQGKIKREGHAGMPISWLRRFTPNKFMDYNFSRFLRFYTYIGGRGAWKIALWYLKLLRQ